MENCFARERSLTSKKFILHFPLIFSMRNYPLLTCDSRTPCICMQRDSVRSIYCYTIIHRELNEHRGSGKVQKEG